MLPLVLLSGSAFAQGLLHGQVLRRELRYNLSRYFRRFTLEIGRAQAASAQAVSCTPI